MERSRSQPIGSGRPRSSCWFGGAAALAATFLPPKHMKPISGAAPLLMVIANIADPSGHGEGVILWRTNEKSAPGIKQTRQVIDLAGFSWVRGQDLNL